MSKKVKEAEFKAGMLEVVGRYMEGMDPADEESLQTEDLQKGLLEVARSLGTYEKFIEYTEKTSQEIFDALKNNGG